jgi:hypothetical protein
MAKCIYCGEREATEECSGIGCGCDETPDYMRASAPVYPAKRRCVSCVEFTDNCNCGRRGAEH